MEEKAKTVLVAETYVIRGMVGSTLSYMEGVGAKGFANWTAKAEDAQRFTTYMQALEMAQAIGLDHRAVWGPVPSDRRIP